MLDSVQAPDIPTRARRLAALGDPVRLAIVDELATSDRAPVELRDRFGLESNLLAHHLDVLEEAGLVGRSRSSGDGRRRYVHLAPGALRGLLPQGSLAGSDVMFVCTHNSARSQLAAALWRARAGGAATSAGTHPADRVHPDAVAAARRAGLDLSQSRPHRLDEHDLPEVVVTVCDRAHEELGDRPDWLHWSIPDPVVSGRRSAFDAVVGELTERIDAVAGVGGGSRG
jgi:protein-tyrosine-phosphatase